MACGLDPLTPLSALEVFSTAFGRCGSEGLSHLVNDVAFASEVLAIRMTAFGPCERLVGLTLQCRFRRWRYFRLLSVIVGLGDITPR